MFVLSNGQPCSIRDSCCWWFSNLRAWYSLFWGPGEYPCTASSAVSWLWGLELWEAIRQRETQPMHRSPLVLWLKIFPFNLHRTNGSPSMTTWETSSHFSLFSLSPTELHAWPLYLESLASHCTQSGTQCLFPPGMWQSPRLLRRPQALPVGLDPEAALLASVVRSEVGGGDWRDTVQEAWDSYVRQGKRPSKFEIEDLW